MQIKIFLGYHQNQLLKMHLHRSVDWKEGKLLGQLFLAETVYENKDYIGLFIPPLLTYAQLKDKEGEIKTHLRFYCPKLDLDKETTYLFSQLFIS
jgi:hypothetical protein